MAYTKPSPYYNTSFKGSYLDVAQIRIVPSQPDDVLYEVTAQYEYRPDLLAYDLYGNPGLWWIFAVRNQDTISDPIFDLYAGQLIYLPKKPLVHKMLGV